MTHPIRRLLPSALLAGLSLFVIACSGPGSASSPTMPATSAPSPSASGGGMVDATGDWQLVRGTSAGVAIALVQGSDITFTVNGTQVSGRSACNQYGGEVIVANGQVRFGPMMMTEMACAEPIMASEAAYTAALAKVTGASRAGDTLTLMGDGVELVYQRLATQSPTPEIPPAP